MNMRTITGESRRIFPSLFPFWTENAVNEELIPNESGRSPLQSQLNQKQEHYNEALYRRLLGRGMSQAIS